MSVCNSSDMPGKTLTTTTTKSRKNNIQVIHLTIYILFLNQKNKGNFIKDVPIPISKANVKNSTHNFSAIISVEFSQQLIYQVVFKFCEVIIMIIIILSIFSNK